MTEPQLVRPQKFRRPWNFAIVFKSFDEQALNHLIEKLDSLIPDVKLVFRAGPTTKLLWVVIGSNPTRGESSESTKS